MSLPLRFANLARSWGVSQGGGQGRLGNACSNAAAAAAAAVATIHNGHCPSWMTRMDCMPQRRYFSSHNNDKDNNKKKAAASKNDDLQQDAMDFFGGTFDDGQDKLGPTLPPLYQRDATTGRFTGQVQEELSPQHKELLQKTARDASSSSSGTMMEQDELLAARIKEYWSGGSSGSSGSSSSSSSNHGSVSDNKDGTPTTPSLLSRLGHRVRKAHRDLNVLGRSTAAQSKAANAAPQPEEDAVEASTQRLTPEEMKEFRAYMKKHHKVDLRDDDMPILDDTHDTAFSASAAFSGQDYRGSSSAQDMNTEWAIQWRTEQAQRQMDDFLDDNPYADIMPQDLSKSRLVNRKDAKPLPRELLTHTNVSLLQSFLTETGQIKSRVQSRLGARDQRKIARLVKRARALGLIPYQAPFRVEQHGWVHDPTLVHGRPRAWEVEMEKRGLTIARKKE